MKQKRIWKIVIDVLMSVTLLFLMAFQLTDDMYHEWIGAGMLILFLIHNVFNFPWYKSLFKGKYSVLRIFRTIVNIGVLVALVLTAYSGMVMSRYVFEALSLPMGMATARQIHLSGSYVSFVLMGLHLGFHWSMVTNGLLRKGLEKFSWGKILRWVLTLAMFVLAIYGAVTFGRQQIYSYIFLQNHFVMFDFEAPALQVIFENFAMLSMWTFVGYYFFKGVEKLSLPGKDSGHENKLYGAICFLVVSIVVAFSIVVL